MATEEQVVFLVKANDELISHCRCESAFIGYPAQMDCPWCGCGWLFVCPKCRRAFTFARAEAVDLSWAQLAHLDLDGKYGRQPTGKDIEEWIGFMQLLTRGLEVGKEYVYLDGWVFPTDSRALECEGMHARHRLPSVPHVDALQDRAVLDHSIGSKEYWQSRRIDE